MMFSLIEVLSVRGDLYPKLRANPNEAEKVQGGEKKKKLLQKLICSLGLCFTDIPTAWMRLEVKLSLQGRVLLSQERAQAGQ